VPTRRARARRRPFVRCYTTTGAARSFLSPTPIAHSPSATRAYPLRTVNRTRTMTPRRGDDNNNRRRRIGTEPSKGRKLLLFSATVRARFFTLDRVRRLLLNAMTARTTRFRSPPGPLCVVLFRRHSFSNSSLRAHNSAAFYRAQGGARRSLGIVPFVYHVRIIYYCTRRTVVFRCSSTASLLRTGQ